MRVSRITAAVAAAALLAFGSTVYSEPAAATGSVSGTVVSADHKPASGVVIKMTVDTKVKQPTADAPPTKKKKSPGLTATTNEKGEFKVENIPPGQYQVSANGKEAGRAKGTVVVKPGEDSTVTLQLIQKKT